ncbi:hypothetical protein EUX98_g1576 [Antrodiella citrinella]|uniref:Uncharacterized protein n=1 Tax=Antrodiella citrinella TaxID=2447956 RepID=A0A4S4N136_9APHY|nr:hypothetical protein EUX98_g1576 [Antrodiella citrinella]
MSTDKSPPYYGPVGETSSDILLEKTFMASGYLTGVGFGVQFVLYCMCTRALWNHKPRTSFTNFLLAYIFVLNAMNTIWTGTSAYGLQLTYIDNRNYPGGPLGFLGVEFSIPANVLSLAALITGNLLADGLLLWRCYVIWASSLGTRAIFVMIFPALMLVGSLVTACFFAISTVSPSGFFSQTTVNFGLPYFTISLALNILLTGMIVLRMLSQRAKSRLIFGKQYDAHYTSMSTIFIESAATYCLFAILLLITYAIGNPINQIWLGLSPAMQMFSTYLIIYRVVSGRAWTRYTWNPTSQQPTDFAQSETRVAHSTSEGPYQLKPIDEAEARVEKSSYADGSWESGKEA